MRKNPYTGMNHLLFNDLHRQFYKDAFVLAQKLLSDIEQARDAVLDILYRVSRMEIEELSADAKKAYLLTAVRNNCLNYLEKHGRQRRYILNQRILEDQSQAPCVESTYNNEHMYTMVLSLIKYLSATNREIMELLIGTKLNDQQIANQLNISVPAVQTRKSRAKEELIRLIKAKGLDTGEYNLIQI